MKEKIKKIINGNIVIVNVILSIILTIGMNLSINIKENKMLFDGNQIIWLMLCILIYYILRESEKLKEKRLIFCSMILGILFAVIETIGKLTNSYWGSAEVILSKKIIVYIIIKIIVYGSVFTNAIKIIMNKLSKIKVEKKSDIYILRPTLKTFIIVAILFFIAWLPYFINYYPAITSFDTNYQLMQGYGIYEYTNHHPIMHTLIITFFSKIGYGIAGNYNLGMAMYAIIQMLMCALTYSFTIYYMGKKNIPKAIRILTFIFFAFNPIVPQFSIAVWKDVPFSMAMLLFVIAIIESIKNKEIFKNYKFDIALAIDLLAIMFFRNNGLYVVLLTFPLILIARRKSYKQIIPTFIIPIAIYIIITGPVYAKLNIVKSSPGEMLSIPLQQMARISINKWDELTENEKERIAMYIPTDKVKELYRSNISDPVKNSFNVANYKQNKVAFFKLYVKLALHFPIETIESLIAGTYGYYYPDMTTFPVAVGNYESPLDNEKFMEIKHNENLIVPGVDKVINTIYDKKMPIVSLLANIGFAFWVVMILLMYNIYRKKYENILMYIPIAVLYLTCLASPVSGELRYIYSMFISIPLFIGFAIDKVIDNK